MKTVFVAYPYSIANYRETIATASKDVVEVVYADNVITNKHILQKITDLMKDADLCIFDLTGWNANVALELGVAIGLNLNYRILLGPTPHGDVFSDMRGWDQLRYDDSTDLCSKLNALFRHDDTFRRPRAITEQELAVQPYLHIDLHGGMGGSAGSFLEGFVRNAGEGIAQQPMLRLPELGDTRLGGIMKPGEPIELKFRYDDKPCYVRKLDDPMASVEFGDRLGNLYRQEGPVTQNKTPGGSVLTYHINAFGLPYKIQSRDIPLQDGDVSAEPQRPEPTRRKPRAITNQEIARIGFGQYANALTETHYGSSSNPSEHTSSIDVFDETDDSETLRVVQRLPECNSFKLLPVSEGVILSDAASFTPRSFGSSVNGIHITTAGHVVVRFAARGHELYDLFRTLGSVYALARYMHRRYEVSPVSNVVFGFTIIGDQEPGILPTPSYQGAYEMDVVGARFAECATDAVVACLRDGSKPRQARAEIANSLEEFWRTQFSMFD